MHTVVGRLRHPVVVRFLYDFCPSTQRAILIGSIYLILQVVIVHMGHISIKTRVNVQVQDITMIGVLQLQHYQATESTCKPNIPPTQDSFKSYSGVTVEIQEQDSRQNGKYLEVLIQDALTIAVGRKMDGLVTTQNVGCLCALCFLQRPHQPPLFQLLLLQRPPLLPLLLQLQLLHVKQDRH